MSNKQSRAAARTNGNLLVALSTIKDLGEEIQRLNKVILNGTLSSLEMRDMLLDDLHTCALADDEVWAFNRKSQEAFEQFVGSQGEMQPPEPETIS